MALSGRMIKQSGRSIKKASGIDSGLKSATEGSGAKAGGSIKKCERAIIPHVAKTGQKSA
jgi:hypothetical protein